MQPTRDGTALLPGRSIFDSVSATGLEVVLHHALVAAHCGHALVPRCRRVPRRRTLKDGVCDALTCILGGRLVLEDCCLHRLSADWQRSARCKPYNSLIL